MTALAQAAADALGVLDRDWQAERDRQRYRRDPVAYCREVLGFEPWSKQREILEAVRDHRRVAVRSCHGVGKTAVAAWVLLWFHDVFTDSRIISTAPTFEPGVKDLLWREVRKAHSDQIGGKLLDTRLERAPLWFAAGYSTDQPERFSGHHAGPLLLIVDEASGVHEAIYEASEGYLTSENAKVLLIGNPTRKSGTFYRAFHRQRAGWKTIHISAYDAPCFTGEHVSDVAREKLVSRRWVEEHRDPATGWGEDSPEFQVRVLGEFPAQDEYSIMSVAKLEAAQSEQRWRALPVDMPVAIVCDVARFGDDETVIGRREGRRLRVLEVYRGRDTMTTAGKVLGHARDAWAELRLPVSVVIDDAGVGGGVTDSLAESLREEPGDYALVAYNGACSPLNPREYLNRRGEDWFALAEQLDELALDPDDELLIADLLAPRYRLDSKNRRVLESKDETKRRLKRSPDRGDMAVMAFSLPDRLPQAWDEHDDRVERGETLADDLTIRRLRQGEGRGDRLSPTTTF